MPKLTARPRVVGTASDCDCSACVSDTGWADKIKFRPTTNASYTKLPRKLLGGHCGLPKARRRRVPVPPDPESSILGDPSRSEKRPCQELEEAGRGRPGTDWRPVFLSETSVVPYVPLSRPYLELKAKSNQTQKQVMQRLLAMRDADVLRRNAQEAERLLKLERQVQMGDGQMAEDTFVARQTRVLPLHRTLVPLQFNRAKPPQVAGNASTPLDPHASSVAMTLLEQAREQDVKTASALRLNSGNSRALREPGAQQPKSMDVLDSFVEELVGGTRSASAAPPLTSSVLNAPVMTEAGLNHGGREHGTGRLATRRTRRASSSMELRETQRRAGPDAQARIVAGVQQRPGAVPARMTTVGREDGEWVWVRQS